MPTITKSVSQDSDDCFYDKKAGTFSLFEVTVGYHSSTNYMIGAGLRFLNILIPRYAVIDSAFIYVCARIENVFPNVNSRIRGEASDNPITFSTVEDFLARPLTGSLVNWDNIPEFIINEWCKSPDIKTVIQEIVNRAGWNEGNALVLFWDDFDDRTYHANGRTKSGYDYTHAPPKAVRLEISYTSAPPPPPVEVSGLPIFQPPFFIVTEEEG